MLFINAVNEVTRERAQSFLTDEHIQRIVDVYRAFADEDGFARVVSNGEIREKDSNLSIPFYVANGNHAEKTGEANSQTLAEAIAAWQESSAALRKSMGTLFKTLKDSTLG